MEISMLSLEIVKESVPRSLKNNVTQAYVDKINKLSEGDDANIIIDNFLSYSKVLREGKYKLDDYLNAVVYVSYKLMEYSNQDAYMRTFPERYAALLEKGTSKKDIASYVAAYNKNKLVNAILEQTMIPVWLLHQDKHNKALNVLCDLMLNARSETVREKAANDLLTHTTKPEAAAPLININTSSSSITDLKETLNQMAAMQREAILKGMPTKEIVEKSVVDISYEETDS